LAREPGLEEQFFAFITENEIPDIDALAVTVGPGLEPALWVGINFAKALAVAWNKPLVAVNHMEGHFLSALTKQLAGGSLQLAGVQLPVLALLISGGHTELVLAKEWLSYEYVGQTRDDAVGEAFDKVARMLGLPYPGGPEISRLAEVCREQAANCQLQTSFTLPRPMIADTTCDFSFAGLKTAVLYLLKNNPEVSEPDKKHIAHEFENAVADVLWSKTSRALTNTGAKTFVIGGGVSANTHIRRVFEERIAQEHPEVALHIPAATLTTDNAIMIALAGFYHARKGDFANLETLRANGNLSLT
ncbi:MAG: tRNA (adenosine(37)-N6)-threonylcarbamoyltransferase complex transferase subunit TsaD, partial [Minisyncoccia bacterium]